MKKSILVLLAAFMSSQALATVDAHDRVYIVVKDIQSEEFFLERAPIIGCYGLARGPQLAQFTAEYKVNSNIGCGGETHQENINYLTCATVVSWKESSDFTGFSEITLNISKCQDKENPKLITMIRTAAKMNFPLKSGSVKLHLIK